MKGKPRFTVRAALVIAAAGVIGAFGACKKDAIAPPPPPPPPPPPAVLAPTGMTATPAQTSVALAWTDNATNETGFKLERCSGVGCTNFAQVGTDLAVNAVAYTDNGLTASTAYVYRIKAFNATDSSAYATVNATTLAAVDISPILVGAGEITTCASSTGPVATATLITSMLSDPNVTVFTAGNNVSDADPNALTNCFDPKWGSFKDRTHYALGTGDFTNRGADAVYSYFGDRTGPKGKGYYSFDLGTWHIVVLSTSTYELGADELTGAGSVFNQWLVSDLAGTTKPCIMAISWERRLFTSGTGSLGRQFNMNTISEELYGAGVDVLVSANDKLYARFPQTTPDGVIDTNKGFRQFIVGTGGRSFDALHAPAGATPSNVEVQQNTQWGVIKFTLNASSYKWEFVPVTSGAFTDTGETNCH